MFDVTNINIRNNSLNANCVANGAESRCDGLHTIPSLAADLEELFLSVNGRTLDTFDQGPVACTLYQRCAGHCWVPLECLNQHPERWMIVPNQAVESVVPRFAFVVCLFAVPYLGMG